MRINIWPLIAALALLTGCSSNENTSVVSGLFNADSLNSQIFKIQTDKDTAVTTADGILVTIPANSIKSSSVTVTLEIKEALNWKEMINAGLTTMSGKDILSSDGMFYIGTKEEATITKALTIKVPTAYVNKDMQLYKGFEANDKIDWQSPVPVTKTIASTTDTGKIMFDNNCASCHAVDKTIIGPPLAWMDKRDGALLPLYVRNVPLVDSVALPNLCCLQKKYGLMTSFPNLTDADISAITKYVDKIAREDGIPETFNPIAECDSCVYYREYYDNLAHKRDSLIGDNRPMASINYVPPVIKNNQEPVTEQQARSDRSFVIPQQYKSEYYEFDITTFGWYNLDILLKGLHGEQQSTLVVRITGTYTEKVQVFLAIPSEKVLVEGGFLKNDKDFGFDNIDGTIPLPQNAEAYIIAISEQGQKLYYTQQHFITSLNQTVDIALSETTKSAIVSSFTSMGLNETSMEVKQSKNFNGITSIDKELKAINNRLANCACAEQPIAKPAIENVSKVVSP